MAPIGHDTESAQQLSEPFDASDSEGGVDSLAQMSRKPASKSPPASGPREPWSGDQALSSKQLFEQHAAFVAKFIVRMGVPRVDVDDLLQEVFLVAHRLGGYQPGPAKPTTFLASVAVKLVRTERRKRRVRSFVEADDERVQLARAPGDPEQDVADRQQLGELKRIVEQLDDDKRAVFVLADLHGETVVSIASGLGIPVDTAYSRLRAARIAFRKAANVGPISES
jgi:RNA polymerase sigma-70 factor (ECF subfamily)